MANSDRLTHFISDICTLSEGQISNQSLPKSIKLEVWKDYFKDQLGWALSTCSPAAIQNSDAPLIIAKHELYGAVLIKTVPTMLVRRTFMFVLSSGEELPLTPLLAQGMTEANILTDCFDWQTDVTVDALASYIYKPMTKMLSQNVKLNFVVGLLISLMFMSGIDTLNFIVPSHSISSYFNVALLLIPAVLTFIMARYILHRANLWVESVAEQRAETLYLSMLWSVDTNSSVDFQKFSHSVLTLAQLKSSLRSIIGGCIALVPLFIIMVIRMPAILLLVPVGLSLICGYLNYKKRTDLADQYEKQISKISQNESLFSTLIADIKPNIYYKRFAFFKDQVIDNLSRNLISQNKITADESSLQMRESLFQGLAMFVAIIVSGHMMSDGLTASHLSIGSAYMILYMVNTVFKSVPRVINVIETKHNVAKEIGSLQSKLRALPAEKQSDQLSSSRIDCEFERLYLAYGCHFSDGESLTQHIKPYSIVDVRGPSGSGKSTFLRTLLGITFPKSGEIRFSGVQPFELSQKERKNLFAYTSQNCRLVTGSLKDNLTLFCADSIDTDTIVSSLKQVNLLDKVNALPLGLSTPIMSSNSSFSTGEKQRIVLAQTLLKPAQILILDEAMSGLPEEMERDILEAIRGKYQYVFRVSHREALHDIADYVIEMGAHNE